jgi:hypothetical protein
MNGQSKPLFQLYQKIKPSKELLTACILSYEQIRPELLVRQKLVELPVLIP